MQLRTLNPERLELCINAWESEDKEGMEMEKVAEMERVLRPVACRASLGAKLSELNCDGDRLI
jgi:hypothetical protein